MATILPLAKRLHNTLQLANDIEARAEGLEETYRLLGRDDLARILTLSSTSLADNTEGWAAYIDEIGAVAGTLSGVSRAAIETAGISADRVSQLAGGLGSAYGLIAGNMEAFNRTMLDSVQPFAEASAIARADIGLLATGVDYYAARMSEMAGSLISALGMTKRQMEDFSLTAIDAFSYGERERKDIAREMEAFNRAMLDSVQPFAEASAIARAAIDGMYAPIERAAESVRRSILEAATIPSANILAEFQASIKPSAADFDAIFGRTDYLASFNLRAEALARVELDWGDAPLAPRRPKRRTIVPLERERPVTRDELEDILDQRLDQHEERLLVRIQARLQIETRQSGIVVATALPEKPPIPKVDGYTLDDVFDWFYRVPRYYCLSITLLAQMVGYRENYLHRKHSEYTAQYGERPLPPEHSRFGKGKLS